MCENNPGLSNMFNILEEAYKILMNSAKEQ